MNYNNLKSAYLISLVTIGAALLAVHPYVVTYFPSINYIRQIVLILGALITTVGVLMWGAYELRAYVNNKLISGTNYYVRSIKKEEIPILDELAKSYFGDNRASIEILREWFKKYPRSLSVVEKIKKNGPKMTITIVGGICILPINNKACELIEKGLLNGINILPDHLENNTRSASGAYVAAIFANGLVARFVVLGYTIAVLEKYFQHGKNIYARPMTTDGLRLCRDNGFLSVNSNIKDIEIDVMCKKSA